MCKVKLIFAHFKNICAENDAEPVFFLLKDGLPNAAKWWICGLRFLLANYGNIFSFSVYSRNRFISKLLKSWPNDGAIVAE